MTLNTDMLLGKSDSGKERRLNSMMPQENYCPKTTNDFLVQENSLLKQEVEALRRLVKSFEDAEKRRGEVAKSRADEYGYNVS